MSWIRSATLPEATAAILLRFSDRSMLWQLSQGRASKMLAIF
jgi:hypothetical protein